MTNHHGSNIGLRCVAMREGSRNRYSTPLRRRGIHLNKRARSNHDLAFTATKTWLTRSYSF